MTLLLTSSVPFTVDGGILNRTCFVLGVVLSVRDITETSGARGIPRGLQLDVALPGSMTDVGEKAKSPSTTAGVGGGGAAAKRKEELNGV